MRTWLKLWWLVGCFAWAGAEPRGGLEARVGGGQLESLSSSWVPAPDWEARWWWNQGGGAAWVRAGALQVGPLVASAGLEGQRAWAPSSALSSGHWGVGVDAGDWGVWALQRPQDFEVGAQARAVAGPWTLGAGLDRTWSLEVPQPTVPPWLDRGRVGLSWKVTGWSAGAEASGQRAPGDAWEGGYRLRTAWTPGGGGLSLRASGLPWTAAALGHWAGGSLGWEGKASDAVGRWTGGWKGSGWNLGFGGLEGGGGWEAAWCQGIWTDTGTVSLGGAAPRGRWSADGTIVWRQRAVTQTWGARWKEPGFGAEARWRVKGLRLGWLGPGAAFDLIVSWSL